MLYSSFLGNIDTTISIRNSCISIICLMNIFQVISSTQMSGGTSRARVYADVNTTNDRVYWDYENHQTDWG